MALAIGVVDFVSVHPYQASRREIRTGPRTPVGWKAGQIQAEEEAPVVAEASGEGV
jgi:hypothetical protein